VSRRGDAAGRAPAPNGPAGTPPAPEPTRGEFVSAAVAEDLRAAAAEAGVPLAAGAGARGGAERLALRFRGRVDRLTAEERRALCDRAGDDAGDDTVRGRTAAIVARVRREGDAALRAMALEFDGAELRQLEVPRAEWRAALEEVDAGLRRAMERAAENIRTVHEAFRPRAVEVEPEPGVVVGRRPDPLTRVGVYAPGGRAAYPSSLLMGVVPAKVAGVEEVVVCSPPGPDGLPSAVVLAAAAIAGADRVFALGGAGAVAAMAYGTESVPRVDRIVGPGNAYVAEAKVQVSRAVAIDSPAGPSELLVIADHTADPVAVARELVAQAEHDPMAAVVCVAVGDETAEQVEEALAELSAEAGRADVVRAALGAQGGVLVAQTYDEAAAFASDYAAEHLQLAIGAPEQKMVLARLRHTGTGVPRRDQLGGVRRLHDRREPRAPHRRARAQLLGALDARLHPLDHVPARDAAGGGADGLRRGPLRRRRGAPRARRGRARVGARARRRAHAAGRAGVPQARARHPRRRRGRGVRRVRAGRRRRGRRGGRVSPAAAPPAARPPARGTTRSRSTPRPPAATRSSPAPPT
jgi:histidinol dehydrogenase